MHKRGNASLRRKVILMPGDDDSGNLQSAFAKLPEYLPAALSWHSQIEYEAINSRRLNICQEIHTRRVRLHRGGRRLSQQNRNDLSNERVIIDHADALADHAPPLSESMGKETHNRVC